MATILAVMGNARRDGYTARVLDALIEGALAGDGITVERVHLLDHTFGPCRSCYSCIRDAEHCCVLRDDMGAESELVRLIQGAHAMAWATPVHCWTADALIHLFIERLYPNLWSGALQGIPVATLAVASNQGFQIAANRQLCQWALTTGARYVGGLPVHAAYLDEALRDAAHLGARLAQAALLDEREGRRPMADSERWLAYQDAPWAVYPHYVENLTRGSGDPALSIIRQALAQGTFARAEAIERLAQADEAFQRFAHHRALGEHRQAIEALVRASALWTHATWAEFLEEELIKAPPPEAYRPLD